MGRGLNLEAEPQSSPSAYPSTLKLRQNLNTNYNTNAIINDNIIIKFPPKVRSLDGITLPV